MTRPKSTPGRPLRWLLLAGAALIVALLIGAVVSGVVGPGREEDESSPRAEITTLLREKDRQSPVIAIKGLERERGAFEVHLDIRAIPCPGSYRFSSEGALLQESGVDKYTADVELATLGRSPSCGHPVPPRFDSGSLTITGTSPTNAGEIIGINGERSPEGLFDGDLDLKGLLCEGRYELIVRFSGRADTRTYRYRFAIREAVFNRKPLDPC